MRCEPAGSESGTVNVVVVSLSPTGRATGTLPVRPRSVDDIVSVASRLNWPLLLSVTLAVPDLGCGRSMVQFRAM